MPEKGESVKSVKNITVAAVTAAVFFMAAAGLHALEPVVYTPENYEVYTGTVRKEAVA